MTPYPDDPSAAPPPHPAAVAVARAAATPPGVFLVLNGLLGLVVLGLLSVYLVFDPEGMVAGFKDWAAKQPPGPERQDLEQKLAEFEAQLAVNREAYVRQNALVLGGLGLLNLLGAAGGVALIRTRGYRLAVLGSVVSLIPFATGCCITGMPFGLWGLVVLFRPETRAAFAANRAPPPAADPDAKYLT